MGAEARAMVLIAAGLLVFGLAVLYSASSRSDIVAAVTRFGRAA